MANPTYIRGATFRGSANLKTDDGIDQNNIGPYTVPTGATVEIHFPKDLTQPTPVPVILSTLNVGEITVANSGTTVQWKGPPIKSLLLGLGRNLTVGIKVISAAGDVDYFEKQKVIDAKDPDNT